MISGELVAALRSARHVTVFTGAGVSAESGIATFRDAQSGLWAKYDATELATPEACARDAALVWGWYEWRRQQMLRAAPNPAHVAIAALVGAVPALSVITQNVDDLHERAGSRDVIHLHGRLLQPRCFDCGAPWTHPPGAPRQAPSGERIQPPACPRCSGPIRPGVVWFGEALPDAAWQRAVEAARHCDLLLSVGTSALVYPAAELPQIAVRNGATVIQVNPAPTALDDIADWNLHGAAGEVLPALVAAALG